MKHNVLKKLSLTAAMIISMMVGLAAPAAALDSTTGSNTTSSTTAAPETTTKSSTASTARSEARLQAIINRGNSEINRRLTILNTLDSKISSTTKLSAVDQSTLTTEVNNEISGLTSLKTTLDSETQVANAITDAENIFSDYRVFALVVPQVNLIQTADQQQTTEAKLSSLATKIQSDISADQNDGKNVTNLQNELNLMTAKVQSAQTISSNIETTVIALTPSDYDSNHTVLSGDRNQLKTAQSDIVAAISDAKVLIAGLK